MRYKNCVFFEYKVNFPLDWEEDDDLDKESVFVSEMIDKAYSSQLFHYQKWHLERALEGSF